MKTLKSILLGLALLLVGTVVNAAPNPTAAMLSKSDALDIYTNAVIHGKIDGLEQALSKNVELKMYRGEKVFKLNKQAIMDSFKASENVEQTCKYTTSTVEDNANTMIVKLEMQYDSYVRVTTITIKQEGKDWKIADIETRAV